MMASLARKALWPTLLFRTLPAAVGAYLIGCGGGAEQPAARVERSTAPTAAAITAGVPDGDGGAVKAAVTGAYFYWNGDEKPGNEVYALIIGNNYHAVSGCKLTDFDAVLNSPFNKPTKQFQPETEI